MPCRNFVVMVRPMRSSAVMMSGGEFVVSACMMPDAVMPKVMMPDIMMFEVGMTEFVVSQMGDAVPQAQKEHRQRHPQPDKEQQKVKVRQSQPIHFSSRQPEGCRRQLCGGHDNLVNRPRSLPPVVPANRQG